MSFQDDITNWLNQAKGAAGNFFQQPVAQAAINAIPGAPVAQAIAQAPSFAQSLVQGVQFASQPGNTPMDFLNQVQNQPILPNFTLPFDQSQYAEQRAAATNPQPTVQQNLANAIQNTDPTLGLLGGTVLQAPTAINAVKGAAIGAGLGTGLQLASGQNPEDVFSPGNLIPQLAFGALTGGHGHTEDFIRGLEEEEARTPKPPVETGPLTPEEVEAGSMKGAQPFTSGPPPTSGTIDDALARDFATQQNLEQRAKALQFDVAQGVNPNGAPDVPGTLNNSGENRLFRQAVEHPEQVDDLASQATNPEAFKSAVGKFQNFTDHVFGQLKDAGARMGYLTDYYSHILDLSNPADAEKFQQIMDAKAANYKGWFSKDRVFSNIEELEAAGLHLKNPSVVQDIAEYTNGAQKALRAQVLPRELNNVSPGSAYVTLHGEAPPANMVQSRIPGLKGTYLRQDVQHQVKFMEPQNLPGFVKAIDQVNSKLKFTKLFGGGFHLVNTGIDYLAQELGHGRFPRIDQLAAYTASPEAWNAKLNDYIASGVVDRAGQMGVTLSRMDDVAGKPGASAAAKGILNITHRAIFDRAINFMKLEAVRNTELDPASPEARALGAQINNVFGGQNLELMKRNPLAQLGLRLLTLAPDYQEGRVRRTISALNPVDWSPAGRYAKQTLGMRLLLVGALTEAARAAMGKPDQNVKDLIQNAFIDPNIPLPYNSPNGRMLTASLPSSPLTDIVKAVQDPRHAITSHAGAALSLANQLQSGKDYYGHDITPSGLISSQLPIPVGQAQKVLQGQESKTTAALNIAGLRVHTDPNDPAVVAAKEIDTVKKTLTDVHDQAAWQLLEGLDNNDPQQRLQRDLLLQRYPNVFSAKRDEAIALANGDMSKVDPLYTSPHANDYLRYEQLQNDAKNSAEAKAFGKSHPDVFALQQQRSAFFQANPVQNPNGGPSLQPPVASPYVQQALLMGMFKDAQVQQYLQDKTLYDNVIRQQQGLAPQDQFGNILGTNAAARAAGNGSSRGPLRPFQTAGLFGLRANSKGQISNPVRPLRNVKPIPNKVPKNLLVGKSISRTTQLPSASLKTPTIGKGLNISKAPKLGKLSFKPQNFKPAA